MSLRSEDKTSEKSTYSPLTAAVANFSSKWWVLLAQLTGGTLSEELEGTGLVSRVVLGAFPAEITSMPFFITACSFVRPSNWRDKFCMASRRLCCIVGCACETLAAGGEAISWYGGDAPSSETTSSALSAGISCFGLAQCLLGAAKAWLFFGVLQPGQSEERLGLTIIMARYKTHGASELKDYKRAR